MDGTMAGRCACSSSGSSAQSSSVPRFLSWFICQALVRESLDLAHRYQDTIVHCGSNDEQKQTRTGATTTSYDETQTKRPPIHESDFFVSK